MTSPGSQQTESTAFGTEGLNSPRPAPAVSRVGMEERIAASLDAWKRKLIDISKRNRALNFRMTKVSTVAIVDEQPAEVFRHLYLQERTMKFRAALPDQAQ